MSSSGLVANRSNQLCFTSPGAWPNDRWCPPGSNDCNSNSTSNDHLDHSVRCKYEATVFQLCFVASEMWQLCQSFDLYFYTLRNPMTKLGLKRYFVFVTLVSLIWALLIFYIPNNNVRGPFYLGGTDSSSGGGGGLDRFPVCYLNNEGADYIAQSKTLSHWAFFYSIITITSLFTFYNIYVLYRFLKTTVTPT